LIEELSLRGFKSYRDRQTITFNRGVNKISGRNAAGKTTILEAVIFGLFGEVPGVDKRELVSLGLDSLYVRVAFRSPLTGQRATIIREGEVTLNNRTGERSYRSKSNTLQVEDEATVTRATDIQARLKELLGVGRTTFLNVVYAKQKEFIEIVRPRDEKRMDSMLGLTTPAEVREQLRETKKVLQAKGRVDQRPAIEERIRNAEQTIRDARDQIRGLETRRAEQASGLDELKNEQRQRAEKLITLDALMARIKELRRTSQRLEQLNASRENTEENLRQIIEELEEDPDKLAEELEAQLQSAKNTEQRLQRLVDETLDPERIELGTAVSRLTHQVEEHAGLREQGLAVCPKCGQRIDYALIEKDIEQWKREREEKQLRLRAVEQEIGTIKDQVKASRRKGDEARSRLDKLRERLRHVDELKRNIQQLTDQGSQLNQRVEAESETLLQDAEEHTGRSYTSTDDAEKWLEADAKEVGDQNTRLLAEIRGREATVAEITRSIEGVEARIEQSDAVLRESNAALDGISEYESKIGALERILDRYTSYETELRENTLRLLEYRTYEYFQRLTDQQLYSGCHIDRDRYTLEVQPIGSPRALPAWRAGGGHESLLALAERLALLRVMEFPHMLILDEPTDAVDSENVPQLLDYVARTSEEIGQVLLFTHHGYGDEQGVNLITVTKSGSESRVQQGL
jgi:DNA repair exonuclease SbcCD ATPase subunit